MRKSFGHKVTLAACTMSIILLGLGVEARQWTSVAGETAPAGKAGWWLRVNPQNQASHIFLRFGAERDNLGAPMGWIQGTSPEAIDVTEAYRTTGRLWVAAIGMPPSASVSVCLFYADRGVALLEFTQEATLEVQQGGSAEQCVP